MTNSPRRSPVASRPADGADVRLDATAVMSSVRASVGDVDFLRPILAVQQLGDLLGLPSVAADDRELVLALLAVPDGVLPARAHRDTHLADVLRDLVRRHRVTSRKTA